MQQVVKRAEYTPPDYEVAHTRLRFTLDAKATLVSSELDIKSVSGSNLAELSLHGEHLALRSVKIDGKALSADQYMTDAKSLRIKNFPAQARLETVCEIDPSSNLAFTGLYLSNGNLFTQCEAEGFRRITYFPDRPDVMSRYEVYLEGPRETFPVLLSNGNLVGEGLSPGRLGWHWAQWSDPFPKPSYLFALVAGIFVATEKTIDRPSGKPALLQVWVEPGNEDKTGYAMESLINAIRWDERRYGLALDLDRFMIVASADFNMGAMENKGLNIFNTKYVFANAHIATDTDFEGVEAVVGHEYFHNWTGNRVTCRDWFQLTLKEGLTVFRDQEFTADQLASLSANRKLASSARAVKRIDDVRVLRASQFAEDAGPMAHPIRPESYSEINNFYTVTVYEKGAEVIRMLQTLLGVEGFRKGMDLYFARHDGQAVTCDDFVAAMADANQRDLSIFKRWYAQAGTPVLDVAWQYHPAPSGLGGKIEISFSQSLPQGKGPGLPLHIPIALGALDEQGNELLPEGCLFELCEGSATVTYEVGKLPHALSVLRNFSAPVMVRQANLSSQTLSFLAGQDTDPFNRWDACQQLAIQAVLANYRRMDGTAKALQEIHPNVQSQALMTALNRGLNEAGLDPAYLAALLTLPSEVFIAEQIDDLQPFRLRAARNQLLEEVANGLHASFLERYLACSGDHAYVTTPAEVGRRALRSACLAYLGQASLHADKAGELALTQFSNADNMTDRWAAVSALINTNSPARTRILESFEAQYRQEALVMDKWFSVQVTSQVTGNPAHDSVLHTVKALMQRSDFSLRNPNRARAVVHSFCAGNLAQFHRTDGEGYRFWESMVLELDRQNPQVAARLARALDRWKRFAPELRAQMKLSLERMASHANLSGDVREVITKSLRA